MGGLLLLSSSVGWIANDIVRALTVGTWEGMLIVEGLVGELCRLVEGLNGISSGGGVSSGRLCVTPVGLGGEWIRR